MPHISVVVPVYNEEAATLSEFVLQLKTGKWIDSQTFGTKPLCLAPAFLQ